MPAPHQQAGDRTVTPRSASTFTVLILDPDADSYAQLLSLQFPAVRFLPSLDPAHPVQEAQGADALVTFGIGVPDNLLDLCPKVRWIQALSTGTDQFLPLLSAAKRDILLTSTRGIHGASVSEHAIFLMLSLARHGPRIFEQQRQGQWSRFHVERMHGKTVGVLGAGVIGTEILRKCRAFGMATIAFGSTRRSVPEADRFHIYDELENIAGELDFMVVVAPLNDRTRGVVNRRVLNAIKASAYVVNVGRGATIDEDALVEALQKGWIAAAGLDAFSVEPLPQSSPLWRMGNAIITPHVAGNVEGYQVDVVSVIATNLRALLNEDAASFVNVVK